MGSTESYNGQPAPYGRCAIDPCAPYGYICWRNPQKPAPASTQLRAILKAQGCEAEANGDIPYCSRSAAPHPGPPVASGGAGGGMFKSTCHVVGGSIQCDPSGGPGVEQFAGGDSPQRPGSDVFVGGSKDGGPPPARVPPPPGLVGGTPQQNPCPNGNCGVDGGPPLETPPPPPCDMPSFQDLALTPDDGAVAVAYSLAPEGGDIAVAQSLAPDDGDIAVALALSSPVTLQGGVKQNDVFYPQPPPTVLRGKVSVNGWPTAPDKPLQGYVTKSLRIPVTYKPNPIPGLAAPPSPELKDRGHPEGRHRAHPGAG